MSLAPVRFLHAADIFLDSPLRDIPAGLTLPEEIEQRLETATITAFERMIDAALEAKVDFVLLTGNTFVEVDHSLAARIALLDGLYRLADQEVRVFVTPGENDPADAWQAIPDLPENVTIFFERESEPVAVLRDGKVVATITAAPVEALKAVASSSPADAVRRGPFRVMLLSTAVEGDVAARLEATPAEYFALSGTGARRTTSLKSAAAHHPGPLQSLSRTQCGPHGCTLVDVDANGKLQMTCIPTAAAIRESITIDLTTKTDLAELLGLMHVALERNSDLANQPVRIVDWQVRGSGTLVDSLVDDTQRAQLIESFEAKYPPNGEQRTLHAFHLSCDDVAVGESDATAADFFQAITLNDSSLDDALAECLEAAANSDYAEQLLALVPKLDKDAILARAQRLGTQWFRPTATGDSMT